jgi:ribonuclease HII
MQTSLFETEEVSSDLICGLDEAGRGPLAGPVFAAAVILPPRWKEIDDLTGLTDSKRLSPEQRERLDKAIKTHALDWAIAQSSAKEIDQINILKASLLAMTRALSQIKHKTTLILIDGSYTPTLPDMWKQTPAQSVVKGDSKIPAISAASILAKVARDLDCLRLDQFYPGYSFAKHKGYGTELHLSALQQLGPCPEHRKSFKPTLDWKSSAPIISSS